MNKIYNKTKRVCINFTEDAIKRIDYILEHGSALSRSELIRSIVDGYLIDYTKMATIMGILTPQQIFILGD